MSEMGSLSGCILENHPESQCRARSLRGKALVASTAIEAGLLATMLIWPLIRPDVLGGRLIVTPLPPYSGGNSSGELHREKPDHRAPAKNDAPRVCFSCSRPATPSQAGPSGNGAQPDNAPGLDGDFGPGVPGFGPAIPGADPKGMGIEIKRPERPQATARQHLSEGVMEAALVHKVVPPLSEHGTNRTHFGHREAARHYRDRRKDSRTRSYKRQSIFAGGRGCCGA